MASSCSSSSSSSASSAASLSSLIFLALLLCSNFSHAAAFNETCRASDPPCQALLAYRVQSPSSIANISSLFSVHVDNILSTNGFSPGTDVSTPLANITLKLTVTCSCHRGLRSGSGTYNIAPGDWLSAIAMKFGGLVTYQEIAAASGIADPNKIVAGQNLTIPYPCSCQPTGRNASYMSYVVLEGESAGGFAKEYGISVDEFVRTNPENEPGDVVKLPVESCKADFAERSVDGNLTVPSGSYAITANGCVQCGCNKTKLVCTKAMNASSTCKLLCQGTDREVGYYSSSEGNCEYCSYNGFVANNTFTNHQTIRNGNGSCEAPAAFSYASVLQGVPEALGGSEITPTMPPSSNNPVSNTPNAASPAAAAAEPATMILILAAAAAALLSAAV